LLHEPGSKFHYTTYGYSVLGCAIEGATGMGYEDYMHEKVETLASRNLTKPPSFCEAVNIAIQVTDALADAHAHGILHRDIKPENIIIGPKGHVKVLDFGLAKKLEDDFVETDADTLSLVLQSGALIGTVPYMSPEQVRGEKLDGRSDIFTIGTVLYEMRSGKQPFKFPNPAQSIAAILTSNPQSLKSLRSGVPAELERVGLKCLEKDKERRYQSGHELLVGSQKDRKGSSVGSFWKAGDGFLFRRCQRVAESAVIALVNSCAGYRGDSGPGCLVSERFAWFLA
ncbi:MAG: protein kinase domain-containing protein, partial [Pyrinomonadaceae bacterium]